MNITNNERMVLLAIADNDYGGEMGGEVWADSINDSESPSGLVGRDLSGAVSSLVRKGLVSSWGKGRDAMVQLTDAGIAAIPACRNISAPCI